MIIDNATSNNGRIPITITSVAVAICFLAAIAIFITRIFRQAGSCCRDLCRKNSNTYNNDENENNTQEVFKRPKLRYEPLTPLKNLHKSMSYSVESLDSLRYAAFEIPGRLASQPIQPSTESTSGYSNLSINESLDGSLDGRVFVDEYVQPSQSELFSSRQSSLYDNDFATVNPDLYSKSLQRKTQGSSSFGKVRFSLQYEDKSKKKLIMTVHDILGLQFGRGFENVMTLYLSAVLLPERDYRFQSKHIQRSETVELNEVFTFHSRPHNRDFESRTIHLTVTFVEKSSKEIIYGGSRLPLLSHEIYSQVPTDISIGIKYSNTHHEIGDAQILLSYSSDHQKLSVLVKTLKFINQNMLENLTGLHVKAHLANISGDRVGKKRSVSKNLRTLNGGNLKNVNLVEFEDHMAFRLHPDQFLTSTLKLNLHGKHKIMGKHLTLGKIRIGDGSRDEAGRVHWKTVFNSEGVGWTVWHPIYSS